MNDGLKPEAKEQILAILTANPRVTKVVLFGSRAMGTHSPSSDIDIALFGTALTLDDHAKFAGLLDELPIAQKVDLVLMNTVSSQDLLTHIEDFGVKWA